MVDSGSVGDGSVLIVGSGDGGCGPCGGELVVAAVMVMKLCN